MNREQKKAIVWGTLSFAVVGIIGACVPTPDLDNDFKRAIILWVTIVAVTVGLVLGLGDAKK